MSGLNAVIRSIVEKATLASIGGKVLGSMDAFNGVLYGPMELKVLDMAAVLGIHVKGGAIVGTTNRGGPFRWPFKQPDGSWAFDRSDE